MSNKLRLSLGAGSFLGNVWQLTRPYWFSEERWIARGLLVAVIALSLLLVYLQVLFNFWGNQFYNALEVRSEEDFWALIGYFSLIAACYITVAVYANYLQSMLKMRWRRWLTEVYVREWLDTRAYYLLEQKADGTDNPDQRIAQDLSAFSDQTLGLFLSFINAVVTLLSFLGILWSLSGPLSVTLPGLGPVNIPGYMVWVALAYAAIGTWLANWLGRPLIGINFNQERYEADFRYGLVRVRENAESVAVYGGEREEGRGLKGRFVNVLDNWWQLMGFTKRLQWFTNSYGQVAIIFPYLVTAPRYFRGDFRLGDVMQTASAFGKVQESLSWFVDAYSTIASWKASVDRLTTFHLAIARIDHARESAKIHIDHQSGEALSIDHLKVLRPGGELLMTAAALRLEPGQHTVVSGPSGCGKSTLFRVLCGIWPWGEGHISQPENTRVLFLPQRPYLPIGTLREALTYPYGMGTATDGDLQQLLQDCLLGDYQGLLDQKDNWGRRLSPGEQQRLGFARALLHRPDWLFLDEATSAVDEVMERRLYDLLFQRLSETTVISIAHRAQVAQHHTRQWRFVPGDQGMTIEQGPIALAP
jgi:vitamin B12/bleomycin/antimicrobial peptide transport system ATP-binding/permease protein